MRRIPWGAFLALLAGFGLGLAYSWIISPLRVVDAKPIALRTDFRDAYRSAIAAAYAAESGLPFAALRVISDPASRALPALAMAAIKPNGDIDLRKVLSGVARNPLTLRALVSTGIDFNRALKSLRDTRGFLLGGGEGLAAAEL